MGAKTRCKLDLPRGFVRTGVLRGPTCLCSEHLTSLEDSAGFEYIVSAPKSQPELKNFAHRETMTVLVWKCVLAI